MNFRPITGEDWKRELAFARSAPNLIREEIARTWNNMKESKAPVAAKDIPNDWVDMVRTMVGLQRHPFRAHDSEAMIEIQSLTSKKWHPLGLPAGGVRFTSNEERDIILERLKS